MKSILPSGWVSSCMTLFWEVGMLRSKFPERRPLNWAVVLGNEHKKLIMSFSPLPRLPPDIFHLIWFSPASFRKLVLLSALSQTYLQLIFPGKIRNIFFKMIVGRINAASLKLAETCQLWQLLQKLFFPPFPSRFLAVQDSSIGDIVSQWLIFWFRH